MKENTEKKRNQEIYNSRDNDERERMKKKTQISLN
jgi:hypothetical protein